MHWFQTGLLAAAAAAVLGCSEPPVPPEVQQAMSQERDLWRAGALVHAPAEYRSYQEALQAGRDRLSQEKTRFSWFRDYQAVSAQFRQVIDLGRQVETALQRNRKEQAGLAADRIARLDQRVRALRDLIGRVKDKRLSRRSLVAAEIRLEESRRLAAAGRTAEAQARAAQGEADIAAVLQGIRPILARYADPQHLTRWRRLAEQAVAESRRSGGYAIVVRKLDRQLVLYRGGAPVRTYPVGFGFNYLADKLHSGDKATPEGAYRVARKVPGSRYFRALLIDYPNDEDRRRFRQAKKERRVPAGAGIGGLIEIHGGGVEGMTNGCVALENPQMQELYDKVPAGTPVAIVGTLAADNLIVTALAGLE